MATVQEPRRAGARRPQAVQISDRQHSSLVHEPALDGLRGLAVAAVVVFHLGHLRGGFTGVDLFFVLSGFLITSLLVGEQAARGSIDLGRFWSRRARRLLPALFLLLTGVSLLHLALTPGQLRGAFRGEALATLGYVANWYGMAAETTYWDMFSQPSALDHAWSLAIEEQFYVAWPLVLVVVGLLIRRRRGGARPGAGTVGLLALGLAAASFAALALLHDPASPNRAYFGTDTRVGATLLGAALATYQSRRPRRTEPPPWTTDAVGAVALAWLGWSVLTIDGTGSWYYRGGLVAFALAALVVIHAVTGGPPGWTARAISWRPLRALGAISYGVYLWHWPVIVFATPGRVGIDGWRLDAVRVVLTLAVSSLSYRLVEQPVRRGVPRGAAMRRTAAGALAVTVAAVAIASSWGTSGADAGSLIRPDIIPDELPPGATRVMLVGDSGPLYLGPALVAEAPAHGAVAASSSNPFCSVAIPENVARYPDGRIDRGRPCHEARRDRWAALRDQLDPQVVVYYLANAGLATSRLDGRWVTDCDPAYDGYLAAALGDDIDVLARGGARVIIATSPNVVGGSAEGVDCRNRTYQRVADGRPGTSLVDLNAFVAGEGRRRGVEMLRDQVHLSDEGALLVAPWLLDQVVPEKTRA